MKPKIIMESSEQIDKMPELARFMREMFDLDEEQYFVSDKSHIFDFITDEDVSFFWRLNRIYGIGESDIGNGCILTILQIIEKNRERTDNGSIGKSVS